MKLLSCIFICITIASMLSSCKKNPVSPPPNSNDTTSHNFTFQTWHFGEHSSSTLYDVAIIDENNIWTVGEIYMNDTTGQSDPTPYNAIQWNGVHWQPIRIPTKTYSGTIVNSPIKSIICFSYDDIWTFSIAGSFSHWNGINWQTEFVNERQGSGIKIWGTSSNNLYLVCTNGGISFYNGKNWQKIESGTNLDIYDIWGHKTETGNYEILCIASDQFGGSGKKILRITNNIVDSVSNTGLSNSLNAIWFIVGKKYYIGGDGLFSTESLGNTWVRNTDLPAYYKTSIRGNNINDVFVAGAYGLLLHYNGKSWRNYQASFPINGSFGRVDMRGNVVCAVGNDNAQTIVIIGIR